MTLTEMEPLRIHLDSLEMAGKMVDKHIAADSNFPSLINLMRYTVQGILIVILLLFIRKLLLIVLIGELIESEF